MASISISPSVVALNSTVTIQVAAVGASFNIHESAGNFSITGGGGGGAIVTNVVFVDANHVTLTVATGTVAGTLTLTELVLGLSATFEARTAVDPFTLGYQAILAALTDCQTFMALVKPGDVIDASAAAYRQYPKAAGPVLGDDPQIRLLPAGDGDEAEPNANNSSSWFFWQDYQLEVNANVLNVVPLFQVKFFARVALRKVMPDLGINQSINDNLVRYAECYGSAEDSNSFKSKDADSGPGASKGWKNVMTIRIHFQISDSAFVQQIQ